jgi:hypothetical protein
MACSLVASRGEADKTHLTNPSSPAKYNSHSLTEQNQATPNLPAPAVKITTKDRFAPFIIIPKHDYYSERFALEEHERPLMFAGDHYSDIFALEEHERPARYPRNRYSTESALGKDWLEDEAKTDNDTIVVIPPDDEAPVQKFRGQKRKRAKIAQKKPRIGKGAISISSEGEEPVTIRRRRGPESAKPAQGVRKTAREANQLSSDDEGPVVVRRGRKPGSTKTTQKVRKSESEATSTSSENGRAHH